MGYTHYWNTKKSSPEAFEKFSKTVAELINLVDVSICGPYGDGDAVLSKTEVAFNGDSSLGEDFESFSITFGIDASDFCKTGNRPYDKVVVAALIVAKEYGIVSSWSSDGGEEFGDFDEAFDLLAKIGWNFGE